MAVLECRIFSEALGKQTTFFAILPQKAATPSKVLYLLHGLSDDHSIWLRRTSIDRYVSDHNVAVIMPDGGRTFYCDTPDGIKTWTYISEELPSIVQSMFNVSSKREDTYAAGLSMGGYGAFKLALSHPERFQAAASLSGAFFEYYADWADKSLFIFDMGPEDAFRNSGNNIYHLIDQLEKSAGPRPALLQICGTEDFLYKDNLLLKDYMKQHGIIAEYREGPGVHSWEFWDNWIQEVLTWMHL